jgi:hypothetical protein
MIGLSRQFLLYLSHIGLRPIELHNVREAYHNAPIATLAQIKV